MTLTRQPLVEAGEQRASHRLFHQETANGTTRLLPQEFQLWVQRSEMRQCACRRPGDKGLDDNARCVRGLELMPGRSTVVELEAASLLAQHRRVNCLEAARLAANAVYSKIIYRSAVHECVQRVHKHSLNRHLSSLNAGAVPFPPAASSIVAFRRAAGCASAIGRSSRRSTVRFALKAAGCRMLQ